MRLLPAAMDGVPYPQPLTGREPQYVPWGVLLVRPIGHPPRPVPPRAADQRSRPYPTLLRVLRWGRNGHRGGPQTPEAGALASVPCGPLSSRPPPPAVLAPAPPLSTLVFPPSRAPFCSLGRLPCPACPPLSPSALPRTGTLLVSVWAGFRLGSLVPAFCTHRLPPVTLSGPVFAPVSPPHFSCLSFSSPCRPRPLLVGVGGGGGLVLSFPPWHARCGHDASTWRGTRPRGGAAPFLFALPFLAAPLATVTLVLALWGGGGCFLAPSGALRPPSPAAGGKHDARTMQAHSITTQ